MSELSASEGFWYTHSDGRREWMEKPRCDCGGEVEYRRLKSREEAAANEAVTEVVCLECGTVMCRFLKADAAALRRGQELAERYGW